MCSHAGDPPPRRSVSKKPARIEEYVVEDKEKTKKEKEKEITIEGLRKNEIFHKAKLASLEQFLLVYCLERVKDTFSF